MQLEMDGTRDVALETFDKAGQPLNANPFKDLRVRQAFAQAIDAKLIADRVMRGHAHVVGTASAPGFGGYQKDLDVRWPTDAVRAKALLAEAGYPEGFATQLNCPLGAIRQYGGDLPGGRQHAGAHRRRCPDQRHAVAGIRPHARQRARPPPST